ncbi:hypothetical protein HNQ63_000400 [Wenzhouxiangella marina]|uniref:Uncharacterized protein n=1 Tax=Wenzhouxiangella marina TaxID=1579979 RepID=A0A0K0XX43_9GAMM|nr:hypothetical protein WM2015_1898 [Wenzhouxiangella marina]MBB6085963.1 hypothetical protein [Wenzhouxiangella marina]
MVYGIRQRQIHHPSIAGRRRQIQAWSVGRVGPTYAIAPVESDEAAVTAIAVGRGHVPDGPCQSHLRHNGTPAAHEPTHRALLS